MAAQGGSSGQFMFKADAFEEEEAMVRGRGKAKVGVKVISRGQRNRRVAERTSGRKSTLSGAWRRGAREVTMRLRRSE